MELVQIKELINNSLNTAGYETGALEDFSFVDVGTAIGSLTSDQFKTYLQEFSLGVIKTNFDTRIWKKTLDLMTDYETYQGIKQYVKASLIESDDVSIVALVNGTDYNDRVYKSLTTDVLLATKDEGFQISWCKPQTELAMLFSSEEGVRGYIALIDSTVASSMNRNKYIIQLSLLAKLITNAIADGREVPLCTLYNATHTAQVTDTTCMESSDFKNWCKESVANLKEYMTDISTKYNDGTLTTFTPREDIRTVLLTSFSNSLKNITTYDGIGDGALSLGDYQTVNAWQNNGTDLLPTISTTGAISDLNGDGDTVTASNVVGLIFDKWSCSYTFKVDGKVTSDYVPKGDFTKFFANFVGQSFVNTRNNAIALTLN